MAVVVVSVAAAVLGTSVLLIPYLLYLWNYVSVMASVELLWMQKKVLVTLKVFDAYNAGDPWVKMVLTFDNSQI